MPTPTAKRIPRATYRLQLTPTFGFSAAEGLLDYLASLGISDLYLSPIFQAAPGSLHGYDVVDVTQVSEDLGGREAFEQLCRSAAARDMGLVLDFVPNHMGTDPEENAWWQDVLRQGIQSPYADFFDIQWERLGDKDHPRVLLPILENHFGQVLDAGKIRLSYANERLELCFGEMRLPVNQEGYAIVLATLPAGIVSSENMTPDQAQPLELAQRLATQPDFATKWIEAVERFNAAPRADLPQAVRPPGSPPSTRR